MSALVRLAGTGLIFLLCPLGIVDARSAETIIDGRWTSLETECAIPTDGIVEINEKEIVAIEYHCVLLGGDTSNPRHWTMRGRCEEAGEYEDGSSRRSLKLN